MSFFLWVFFLGREGVWFFFFKKKYVFFCVFFGEGFGVLGVFFFGRGGREGFLGFLLAEHLFSTLFSARVSRYLFSVMHSA